METFSATLKPMLTLFFCIAVGFVLVKKKILPESSSKSMAKMETWIFSPALNFTTMMRYCTVSSVSTHALNVSLSLVAVLISVCLAIPLARIFVKEKSAERGIYTYALAFANSGYAGDPIVLALFGEETLAYYKMFCLPFNLFIFTWGISLLIPDGKEGNNPLKRLLNAPTLALFAGILAGLSGLGNYLPEFLISALDMLKACMGPVAMLLAGATIARFDLMGMINKKKVYIATLFRLVIIPTVIMWAVFGIKTAVNSIFDTSIGNEVILLCFFAVATPLGLNTVIFPEAYGRNPETGASMTMVSHTLCVLSIPLMYGIAARVFGF